MSKRKFSEYNRESQLLESREPGPSTLVSHAIRASPGQPIPSKVSKNSKTSAPAISWRKTTSERPMVYCFAFLIASWKKSGRSSTRCSWNLKKEPQASSAWTPSITT